MTSSSDVASVRRFAPLERDGRLGSLVDERAAARAAGYAEGWAHGCQQAIANGEADAVQRRSNQQMQDSALRQRATNAVDALNAASVDLRGRRVPLLDEVGDAVLAAAVTLASAVLGRELRSLDDTAMLALHRALSPLSDSGVVRVRVSPADHAELVTRFEGAPATWGSRSLELVGDPTLSPGESVAEQEGAVVDARISSALERAAAALRAPVLQSVVEVAG